ncbi:MAG TPA: SH3 domain-containing protein [Candidatus Krumholzibacteria bacterium]|nr:SH3 domain-containing protein [Candidatus Krumholzibacteria bacterium]
MMRCFRAFVESAALGLLLLGLTWGSSLAQEGVVTNTLNLRTGPAVTYTQIRKLHQGDELTLLGLERTNHYYHVRMPDGVVGRAYSPRINVLDSAVATIPAADSIPLVFHGCPLEGSAAYASRQARNRLKNRRVAPAPTAIDSSITLARILEPGPDTTRWSNSTGAIIKGYIFDVKPGGEETVNCGDKDRAYRDTHIEVTANGTDTLKTQRMIVEVTPRWRAFMAKEGVNWSTDSLKARLEGRSLCSYRRLALLGQGAR